MKAAGQNWALGCEWVTGISSTRSADRSWFIQLLLFDANRRVKAMEVRQEITIDYRSSGCCWLV
jgi:hypothetical protein